MSKGKEVSVLAGNHQHNTSSCKGILFYSSRLDFSSEGEDVLIPWYQFLLSLFPYYIVDFWTLMSKKEYFKLERRTYWWEEMSPSFKRWLSRLGQLNLAEWGRWWLEDEHKVRLEQINKKQNKNCGQCQDKNKRCWWAIYLLRNEVSNNLSSAKCSTKTWLLRWSLIISLKEFCDEVTCSDRTGLCDPGTSTEMFLCHLQLSSSWENAEDALSVSKVLKIVRQNSWQHGCGGNCRNSRMKTRMH